MVCYITLLSVGLVREKSFKIPQESDLGPQSELTFDMAVMTASVASPLTFVLLLGIAFSVRLLVSIPAFLAFISPSS